MTKYFKLAILNAIVFSVVLCAGCSTTSNSTQKDTTLTQANIVLNLKKGVTTQEDVLNAFGAPNIITTDASGNEIWSYQKNSMTAVGGNDGYYATIILAGMSSGNGTYDQSTKTATLIIKFGPDKKVENFKFMSANF